MSVRLCDIYWRQLDELRHEPTDKRIRATLGGRTVIDSTRAVLLWEPRRVVRTYAVPSEDIDADVAAAPAANGAPEGIDAIGAPAIGRHTVLDPSIPFSVHTAAGEPLVVRVGGDGATAAGFRLDDDALAGYVALDFAGFDAWYEQDEQNSSHPRDPFHRIDIVRSSRSVHVELDGETLAESSRPSDTPTYCAYKGEASYLSAGGVPDVAWTCAAPLREAAEVTGSYAFFNERVDLTVDGEPLERPVTPRSRR